MKLFANNNVLRSYLIDLDFWMSREFKNKQQFRTIIHVLYGRKKDRGHIKQKYKKLIKDFHDKQPELIMEICRKVFGGMVTYGRI